MLPTAFSTEPESGEARLFEQLILDGILAVRSGNFPLARRLLNQAASINTADVRIWIWLSATTDDLIERRTYLSNALEIDPSSQVAKRGLLILATKLAATPQHLETKTSAPPENLPREVLSSVGLPRDRRDEGAGLPRDRRDEGAGLPRDRTYNDFTKGVSASGGAGVPVARPEAPTLLPTEPYTFGLPQAPPLEDQEIPSAETLPPLPGEIERILSSEPRETSPQEELEPLPEEIEDLLSSEPAELQPSTPQEDLLPLDGGIKTLSCPNCGGIISYDAYDTRLVCPICGFTRRLDEDISQEGPEQELEEDISVAPSVQWSEAQARMTCELCGAVILFSLGRNIDCCPYCASSRLTIHPQLMDLVDPQAIGTFTLNADQASKAVKSWLGKGLLAPDILASRQAGLQLHPGYYPFWLISGKLEVPWFCDVKVSSGNLAKWEAQSGSKFAEFEAILVPALRKLSDQELAALAPFSLDKLVDFSPHALASWPVLAYDVPLADASVQARDQVIGKVQQDILNNVEAKNSRRNFRTGAGRWNDMTSRLILLPIFVGNYPFQGKRCRLFVNGQTGKVAGNKPIDRLKAIFYSTAAITVVLVAILIIWLLSQ